MIRLAFSVGLRSRCEKEGTFSVTIDGIFTSFGPYWLWVVRARTRVKEIDDPISKLTDAQREVLRLVMAGFKSKEISFQLGIGEDAVNKRLAAAKSVLGTTSRFVAARKLAAFEAQDQTYHSLAGQLLAVDDEPDGGEPAGHGPEQDLPHERPRMHLQVSEPTLEYDPGFTRTKIAVASVPWRLAATPFRVFLLTFIIGVIAALLLRI